MTTTRVAAGSTMPAATTGRVGQQVVGCGLWVVGCGLWVVGCGPKYLKTIKFQFTQLYIVEHSQRLKLVAYFQTAKLWKVVNRNLEYTDI